SDGLVNRSRHKPGLRPGTPALGRDDATLGRRVLANTRMIFRITEVVDPEICCSRGTSAHGVVRAIWSVALHVILLNRVSGRIVRGRNSGLHIVFSPVVGDRV